MAKKADIDKRFSLVGSCWYISFKDVTISLKKALLESISFWYSFVNILLIALAVELTKRLSHQCIFEDL